MEAAYSQASRIDLVRFTSPSTKFSRWFQLKWDNLLVWQKES